MPWLNYASDRPVGHFALITVALAFTSRYLFVGIEKGGHLFADVQDWSFSLHGLNNTAVPGIRAFREHLVSNYVAQANIFRAHVAATALAWTLMPFQIWKTFRNNDIERHRTMGYFVLACLTIGMVASLFLARPVREVEALGGLTSEIGFYGMAVSTSYCASMGLYMVKQGCIQEHKQWMVRAYGTIWGAFFWFRIISISVLPYLPPDKYPHGLGLLANLSWMSGWIGADIALSLGDSNKKVAAKAQRDAIAISEEAKKR